MSKPGVSHGIYNPIGIFENLMISTKGSEISQQQSDTMESLSVQKERWKGINGRANSRLLRRIGNASH